MSIETAVANNIVPVVAIVFGVGWLIIWTILEVWQKARTAEQNAVLKKDMIGRGFSADEIVRVIQEGGSAGSCRSGAPASQKSHA